MIDSTHNELLKNVVTDISTNETGYITPEFIVGSEHVDAFNSEETYASDTEITKHDRKVQVERGLISCSLGIAFLGERVIFEHTVSAGDEEAESSSVRYFLNRVFRARNSNEKINLVFLSSLTTREKDKTSINSSHRREMESEEHAKRLLKLHTTYQRWLSDEGLVDGIDAKLNFIEIPLPFGWTDFDVTIGNGAVVSWDTKNKTPIAGFSFLEINTLSFIRYTA